MSNMQTQLTKHIEGKSYLAIPCRGPAICQWQKLSLMQKDARASGFWFLNVSQGLSRASDRQCRAVSLPEGPRRRMVPACTAAPPGTWTLPPVPEHGSQSHHGDGTGTAAGQEVEDTRARTFMVEKCVDTLTCGLDRWLKDY